MNGDKLSERDELTLRFIALCDQMSYAAARRNALSERAAQIRRDEPGVAEAVEAALRYRHKKSNVRELRRWSS